MWDIITYTQLKAIRKPSTVTGNRSMDTKGVTHSHLPRMKREEKDKNTFSIVSVLLEFTPLGKQDFNHAVMRNVRSSSILAPFYSSLPLSHLFWSYLPLWVVVIGRAASLLGAGLEAVAFEMLSLCRLNRCRQT